jgi:hypothetical protein
MMKISEKRLTVLREHIRAESKGDRRPGPPAGRHHAPHMD